MITVIAMGIVMDMAKDAVTNTVMRMDAAIATLMQRTHSGLPLR